MRAAVEMGTVSGGHDQDTAAAGGGQRSSGELSQGPRGSHTHVDMSDTSWFILCLPGHPSAWGRELGHSWSPPPPHPRGKAATSPLVPTPAQRAGPQSHQGLRCWADGQVSVPSGKTERVFLAGTQALEEAAALLPPASPIRGGKGGRPSLRLYPALPGLCHLP